jgi:hypothetical protein
MIYWDKNQRLCCYCNGEVQSEWPPYNAVHISGFHDEDG